MYVVDCVKRSLLKTLESAILRTQVTAPLPSGLSGVPSVRGGPGVGGRSFGLCWNSGQNDLHIEFQVLLLPCFHRKRTARFFFSVTAKGLSLSAGNFMLLFVRRYAFTVDFKGTSFIVNSPFEEADDDVRFEACCHQFWISTISPLFICMAAQKSN